MANPTTSFSAQWGVKDGTFSNGIVTGIDWGGEPILAPVQNEYGAVVQQIKYDAHKKVRVTVVCSASADVPTEGAAFTITTFAGAFSGYVVSADVVESNTDTVKLDVTAECYTNCAATSTPNA